MRDPSRPEGSGISVHARCQRRDEHGAHRINRDFTASSFGHGGHFRRSRNAHPTQTLRGFWQEFAGGQCDGQRQEHVIFFPEANRCRPPECWLRGGRPGQWPCRNSSARLALRYSQLRRFTPLLAAAGYRVIVPYLRGYGTTRFLSSETFRNGQPSVVAVDTIALMDALKIDKAILAGFDWGARTADDIAVLWPERCKALVSVSGCLIGSQASGKVPLPPKAE